MSTKGLLDVGFRQCQVILFRTVMFEFGFYMFGPFGISHDSGWRGEWPYSGETYE